MDTKGIDPHEDRDKVIGCTVMVIGGIVLWGLVILIVGVIDEWVVINAIPTLSEFWRWMTHSKEYRIVVVISAIFGLLACLIPFQSYDNVFVAILQAFVFAVCFFFACFFTLVAVYETGVWIIKWIERGH